MGGSSLGPEVIRRSYGDIEGSPRLHVLDSTDPGAVLEVERSVDLEKTIFVVSSKSGGTVETLSHMKHFHERVGRVGQQFVAVTDPGSPLVAAARERSFRRIFENDPEIGGRYSVLSYFGLVPAVLMGVNIEALLHRCQVAEQSCTHFDTSTNNSGLWLGVAMGECALQGRDKCTFVVSEPISSLGLWVEQLIAESTGKEGKGVLPVADEPLGDPDVYGDDRVFVYQRNADEPDEELDAKMDALALAGQPVVTTAGHGASDLGRVFFFAEFGTAVAGWVLGINPFDQPNVQEAKDNTAKVLAMPEPPQLPDATDNALKELLGKAAPPHYVAIMGYVKPSEEFDAAIAELRATDPRRDQGRHHVRLRAALPALDGPVPQGRPAHRAVPPAGPRRRGGRAGAGRGLHVPSAQERAGRRRPADPARPRPAGRARPPRGRPGGGGAGADGKSLLGSRSWWRPLSSPSGCGGDDASSDEDAIREAIRLSLTTHDPEADCNERLSESFVSRTYQSAARCERLQADDEDETAESVEFESVEVDGDAATVEIATTGGGVGRVEGVLEMVHEDGDWRIDDLSVPLLRTLVEAGFEQTENLPPGGVECLQEGVRAIPDAEFRTLAYMLVGEQPGSQRRIFELLAECEGEGGVSLLRAVFERGMLESLREQGAGQAEIDCVISATRERAPDDELVELLSQEDANEAVAEVLTPAIEACG